MQSIRDASPISKSKDETEAETRETISEPKKNWKSELVFFLVHNFQTLGSLYRYSEVFEQRFAV